MKYETVHGIEWNNGAAIEVYGCPCGDCSNVILKVTDESGTEVKLDLTPCAFGHLMGEMLAFAEKIAGPDDDCPRKTDG
jgi:hypothetical protein